MIEYVQNLQYNHQYHVKPRGFPPQPLVLSFSMELAQKEVIISSHQLTMFAIHQGFSGIPRFFVI